MSFVGIPTGVVLPFAGDSLPEGYLYCNGAAVSRATYPALFSAIGVSHGYGDNSTTFNLPDYRGRFLRGVDGGAENDPDRASRTAMNTGGATGDAVGSVQGHAFQTHNHTQESHTHTISSITKYGNGLAGQIGWSKDDGIADGGAWHTKTSSSQTPTINTSAASGTKAQATANETRPVNANVKYIIKY